jgi:hypothetical protein
LYCRAKDNPSEESGTFDSSGAFHGEDRIRANSRGDLERKMESDQNNIVGSGKSSRTAESEPSSGSQNDRGVYKLQVQHRHGLK